MTPVAEQTRPPIAVDGIEWIPATRPYYPGEGWVAKHFGTFTVADYGPKDHIFQGWCALHGGCGVGVKNRSTHLQAMEDIAPRIRADAARRLTAARENLTDLEDRCKAIGVEV